MSRKFDLSLAFIFAAFTMVFILVMAFNDAFFEFSWGRHHNTLSWYIRPLLLLPFCYFAYRKCFSGMSFSIFALITSMMWFPEPAVVSQQATDFLRMEADYLFSNWSVVKLLIAAMIPLTFSLLGIAFWRRKFLWGFLVIVLSTTTKMLWSLAEGGQSGFVLFPAALAGIVISGVLLYLGQKKGWV